MKVSVQLARRLCRAVFVETMHIPAKTAEVATDVLVDANLRGIDSHGIQVLPYYTKRWSAGQIVANSTPVIVSETPATAVIDARQGMGHYASLFAVDAAIDRARKHGMGAAVVRNSTHNGAISHYTIHAARQGMIGISATACAPRVTPHGGTEGLHGTNPISYALPRQNSDPIVFDFSTGHSVAKLKEHAEHNGVLPEGRVLNVAGQPTTDPSALINGWILPVAGPIGFALALLVDGLTGGLADTSIGRQLPQISETSKPYDGSFFTMAISPDAFGGAGAFTVRINELVRQLESHTPQDPSNPVRWPGQRGWALRRQRLLDGIPISTTRWKTLIDDLSAGRVDIEPLAITSRNGVLVAGNQTP